jgi:hypothetical protein
MMNKTAVTNHLYLIDQFCGFVGSLGPSHVTIFSSRVDSDNIRLAPAMRVYVDWSLDSFSEDSRNVSEVLQELEGDMMDFVSNDVENNASDFAYLLYSPESVIMKKIFLV